MKYNGPHNATDRPKPPNPLRDYVRVETLNEFSKAVGEALGDQLRALQDRIDQLESEIALVRALSKTREDA
jgi:hypothetical protein